MENENERSHKSHTAQAANTLARIVAGAAEGGIAGAVTSATVQLLPAILKLCCVLVLIFLFLPLVLIMGIPCNLFGAPSGDSLNIKEMTSQAEEITLEWKNQRDLEERAIDLLISLLPDDIAGFSIEKNLGNTNDYWLVSIISVHNMQNIMQMDDMTLVSNVKEKLTYTLEPEYDEDGDIVGYTLVISDLTPEAFMNKLNFTDQQRLWANVLYQSLTDAEYSPPDNGTNDLPDMDYSDIIFTGRGQSTEVVYYNQGDKRWANLPYGRKGTIQSSGCGPTSLAICVSTLTNTHVTPPEICDWAYKNGYKCEGNGSYHSLIPDGAAYYGVPCTGLGSDKTKLLNALQSGKLVVAIMSKGHFTNGGHFIVLRGVTDDGKILVADCASYKRSEQVWELDLIWSERNKRAGSGGPFWALG